MRRLQFGDECWYRAVTPEADPRRREMIGYSRDLDVLVMHAYKLYLRGYAANTGPINGWAAAPQGGVDVGAGAGVGVGVGAGVRAGAGARADIPLSTANSPGGSVRG